MLVIPAYAKLNLALEVIARRDDGWHEIDTLIVLIDWHDLIGVDVISGRDTPNRSGTGDAAAALTITTQESGRGDHARGALEGNLAARAAALLTLAAGSAGANATLRVWLHKRIPVAAGLGGGSADAAAVLRSGAELLARRGAGLHRARLLEIAGELGSDVPALLEAGAVRATGRGEHLSPVIVRPLHMAVVFVAPSLTRDVYAALLPDERTSDGRVTRLATTLANASPLDGTLLGSALEPAACRVSPELSAGIARLRAAFPDVTWHMTGSGGAFFCIARNGADAVSLASDASAAGFVARACRSVS